jgi:hypothetical protein
MKVLSITTVLVGFAFGGCSSIGDSPVSGSHSHLQEGGQGSLDDLVDYVLEGLRVGMDSREFSESLSGLPGSAKYALDGALVIGPSSTLLKSHTGFLDAERHGRLRLSMRSGAVLYLEIAVAGSGLGGPNVVAQFVDGALGERGTLEHYAFQYRGKTYVDGKRARVKGSESDVIWTKMR